jgi:GNAT superfamily N-acetyltransferase
MEPTYDIGGGSDRAAAAAALLGEVFKTDPVLNYMLHTMPTEKRMEFFPRYFRQLLTAAAVNHAVFDEAWISDKPGDPKAPPACSAVWMPPGERVDALRSYFLPEFWQMLMGIGVSGLRRMLGDFQDQANKAKKMGLVNADGSRIKAYWYVFFIGTDAAARGKGLGSEIIRRMQAKCEEKALPIWLESTTARSHQLYQRLGFEDVTSWILGKGEVDADGYTKKNGEGVPIWAMVWFPKSWPGRKAKTEKDAAAASS